MRHRRRVKYFGVKTAHRKAMFRNMVTALFQHGRITTTVPRAKELRRLADKMISLAKKGTLHARRQALSVIMDKGVVAKLFEEWAPKMADRPGGYTRIVRIGPRRGDGAMMCIIELVTESLKKAKSKAKVKRPEAEEAPTVIPSAAPEVKDEVKDQEEAPAAEAETETTAEDVKAEEPASQAEDTEAEATDASEQGSAEAQETSEEDAEPEAEEASQEPVAGAEEDQPEDSAGQEPKEPEKTDDK